MTQRQRPKKSTPAFLLAQGFWLLGDTAVRHAISWYITLTAKSGFYTMLSVVCGVLPGLILAPIAGVWVDRYNRKTIMVLTNAAMAASTLLIAFVSRANAGALAPLFVLLVVRSMGSAVLTPCVNTMLPDLMPDGELTRLNGVYASLQSTATLVAPLIAGALLLGLPIESVFFVDVLLSACATFVLLRFLKGGSAHTEPRTSIHYLREMREGFSYVKRHKYLGHLFLISAVYFIIIAPVIHLTPLQITINYGDDVWRLSLMEGIFSAGMIVGGLLVSLWAGLCNRVHTVALARFVMAVATIALALPISFAPYLVVMGLYGVVLPFSSTHVTVLLQENVDPAYRGRMFGTMNMISSAFTTVGMLAFGPMADMVAIEWLLLITGVIMAIMAYGLWRDKALTKVGERA